MLHVCMFDCLTAVYRQANLAIKMSSVFRRQSTLLLLMMTLVMMRLVRHAAASNNDQVDTDTGKTLVFFPMQAYVHLRTCINSYYYVSLGLRKLAINFND